MGFFQRLDPDVGHGKRAVDGERYGGEAVDEHIPIAPAGPF
jgi:hypothetical protein